MANRLDIVLFGASGFTGKRCIESIHKFTKENGNNFKWAIAGRSEYKLKQSLLECESVNDKDLSSIPIILADVKDYESLKAMTAQTRILINCCGPYRLFGEPVIKACIETGTHQLDVSGEPQFMETMQLNYNKAAQEKGVYIISACGYDSIPADLGVNFVENNFKGTLNSVEVYMKLDSNYKKGVLANYGTWQSLIHSMTHSHELKSLRKKLFIPPLPTFLPKLKPKPLLHKFELTNTWNVPFLGADRSVIMRSQRYLYEKNKKRPIQVQLYFGFESIFSIILLRVYERIFSFLLKYNFGRKLLLKYPKLFSCGIFSHNGPTSATLESMKYLLTFIGEGWAGSIVPQQDSSDNPPTSNITVRLTGSDPFYGLTSTTVTLAAMVILEESKKLPESGGVYTPAAAFINTSLLDRLQKTEYFTFEIVSTT
ncbi:hypothetical protein RI129_000875 [Pyrocoelia pectoralis]|uniref:Saccharopine dehydrogenase NADP binding domain-containing protein n=1 Tax=Pyrocoelia pectoralis TaxID=417401 RepID=A0AAN7VTJ3_9COLE